MTAVPPHISRTKWPTRPDDLRRGARMWHDAAMDNPGESKSLKYVAVSDEMTERLERTRAAAGRRRLGIRPGEPAKGDLRPLITPEGYIHTKRYLGLSIAELAEKDPGYLSWILRAAGTTSPEIPPGVRRKAMIVLASKGRR